MECAYCIHIEECKAKAQKEGLNFDPGYPGSDNCKAFEVPRKKSMYDATIHYEAYKDCVLIGRYFLSIDVPPYIAQALDNGFIPIQVENLLQNAILLQGFDKAEIIGNEVYPYSPEEDPYLDITFHKCNDEIIELLNMATIQLVLLANEKLISSKEPINRLQSIINSLKEVLKSERN